MTNETQRTLKEGLATIAGSALVLMLVWAGSYSGGRSDYSPKKINSITINGQKGYQIITDRRTNYYLCNETNSMLEEINENAVETKTEQEIKTVTNSCQKTYPKYDIKLGETQ